MACFRKVIGTTCNEAIKEYLYYSAPKSRDLDQQFIENFDGTVLRDLASRLGYSGIVGPLELAGPLETLELKKLPPLIPPRSSTSTSDSAASDKATVGSSSDEQAISLGY